MKNFDWKAFKNEGVAVYCGDKKEKEDFLNKCHINGIKIDSSLFNKEEDDGSTTFDYSGYDNKLCSMNYDYYEENGYEMTGWTIDQEEQQTNKNKKGNGNMLNGLNNIFGEIGTIEKGLVALTMDGKMAIKRGEDYVRYDSVKDVIENQLDLVMEDMEDMIMLIPVSEVQQGDIIKKKSKFYQVLKVNKTGSLKVVDIGKGTKTNLTKEVTPFGSFYTKVSCLLTGSESTNKDGGNTMNALNPMMLMMMMKDGKEDNNMMKTMLMSQMMGCQQNMSMGMNPMMLMMMNKDKGENNDMMKMMIMSQMFNGGNNMFGGLNTNNNIVNQNQTKNKLY